jgi:ERO1-like protein alpha
MKARRMVGWLLSVFVLAYVPWCLYLLMHKKEKMSLKGKIDDCCTDFQDIDNVNGKLNPLLLQLVDTDFFRFFKVDYSAKCPFWALNQICKNPKSCGVFICDDKEIPDDFRKEDAKVCQQGKMSSKIPTDFYEERNEEKLLEDWGLGEEVNPKSVYVDLSKNKEAFTGYQGQNIWNTIYKDSCFKKETCLEERVLNRAVKGMHTSVSTHLSYHYIDHEINYEWKNIDLYFEKVGDHPRADQGSLLRSQHTTARS